MVLERKPIADLEEFVPPIAAGWGEVQQDREAAVPGPDEPDAGAYDVLARHQKFLRGIFNLEWRLYAGVLSQPTGLKLPEAIGPLVPDRIFPDKERPDFVPFRFVGTHVNAAKFVVDRALARAPGRRLGVPIPGGFVVAQVEIGRSKQRTRSEFPVRLA